MISSVSQTLGLILASFFLLGCNSMFYYPDQKLYVDPADLPVQVLQEKIQLNSGEFIHSWYLETPKKPAKAVVLFFHGNAQNLSSHFRMLAWILDHGYDLSIFDYPGYGESTGRPTPENTVAAGVAALRHLAQNKPDLPRFIFGQSLGGNIAVRAHNLAGESVPLEGLILDGTFSSYRGVARSVLSKHWLTWIIQPLVYVLISDKQSGDISKVSPTPVLIFHGENDPVVPYSEGEKLYSRATAPKKFKSVEMGVHGNTFHVSQGLYRQDLLEFLENPKTSIEAKIQD